MSLLETIKKRRSIHTFKSENVSKEVLKDIFTYASWAPTHYMKEPWEVKIFQGEGKEKFVDEIIKSYQGLGMLKSDRTEATLKTNAYMKNFLKQIPHHALIYFKKDPDIIRYEEDYSAVSAFIQNAQLAAWEYGVGMLWTITPYMYDPNFYEALGLSSDTYKIAAVMQIGYPDKIPDAKARTDINEKIVFIN